MQGLLQEDCMNRGKLWLKGMYIVNTAWKYVGEDYMGKDKQKIEKLQIGQEMLAVDLFQLREKLEEDIFRGGGILWWILMLDRRYLKAKTKIISLIQSMRDKLQTNRKQRQPNSSQGKKRENKKGAKMETAKKKGGDY